MPADWRKNPEFTQGAEPDPQVSGKILLKLIRIAPGCQPELQRTVHEIRHLCAVINSGGIRNTVSLPQNISSGCDIYHSKRRPSAESHLLLPALSYVQTSLSSSVSINSYIFPPSELLHKFFNLRIHAGTDIFSSQIGPGPFYRLLNSFPHVPARFPAKDMLHP